MNESEERTIIIALANDAEATAGEVGRRAAKTEAAATHAEDRERARRDAALARAIYHGGRAVRMVAEGRDGDRNRELNRQGEALRKAREAADGAALFASASETPREADLARRLAEAQAEATRLRGAVGDAETAAELSASYRRTTGAHDRSAWIVGGLKPLLRDLAAIAGEAS